MGYQYVCLRCVPHVDRGEFVNVGVVLHCQDARFLAAAQLVDEARLAALAPDVPVSGVRAALDRIVDLCAADRDSLPSGLGPLGQRFGWIIAPRSTIVQPGPVHGGLCDDPAAELDRLMRRLVVPPDPRPPDA